MSSFANLFKPRQQKQEVERPVRRFIDEHVAKRTVTVGPRAESRTNLTVAVLVVPVCGDAPLAESAFAAVTKDFSSIGLSIVMNQPLEHANLIVGLQADSGLVFAQGHVIHSEPLGGGFSQIGIELTELVDTENYPQLATLEL